MKKVLLLSAFFAFLLAGFGSSGANAGGCNVSCRWSNCKVGGCDLWACGCYFGIASCKCEKAPVVANPNMAAINDFGNFARNSRMPGLMGLASTLKSMGTSDYESFFTRYQAQVESLETAERAMLIAYLGGTY